MGAGGVVRGLRGFGRACVAAGALMLLLTGCTTSPSEPAGSTQTFDDAGGSTVSEVPKFTGPWADAFTSAYQRSSSDFEREILKDGQITDLEFSEMRERFKECLAVHQISNVKFAEDGGFSFDEPDGASSQQIDDWVEQCSNESGESGIGALHSWIRRNPENLDENTIMAACLVRKGAVDPGYTAAAFAADLPDQSFPYKGASGQVAFQECNADPLGLFE